MKFAKIDGIRCEATKSGQRGICPGCGAKVVARCGRVKVTHWAHLSGKDCASWHEPETEWHRMWKNQFPIEWQEKDFIYQKTGEHHRADVHTPHGLTIEFQHSAIKPEERAERENFYSSIGDMIWVVDGTRAKNIWKKFNQNRNLLFRDKRLPPDTLTCRAPEKLFPEEWTQHPVPIFFDFIGTLSKEETPEEKQLLICLFPKRNKPDILIRLISQPNFIELCKSGEIKQWHSLEYEPYAFPVSSNIKPQAHEIKTLNTNIMQPIAYNINGRIYIITPGTPSRKSRRF